MAASGMSAAGNGYGYCRAEEAVLDKFPAGLRVLVVDDDPTCLKTLEIMLRKCCYRVTTCSRARNALNILRDNKGSFDVVISDVHMPDMNGFRLLELVGLEMDLPVIMMSADGSTNAVMEGIKHGACDYLIKPVRMEELKNIWQHVFRKKKSDHRDHEHSGSVEESTHPKRGFEEAEYTSSFNDLTDGSLRSQKKRKDCKDPEEDVALDNEDSSNSKKPRVVWSVELHQQFVSAVNQLGIDKAVPKRILELMNVPGLTRENVASHLQKFRLYLKRLSAVTQHQGGISSSYCGLIETNSKVNSLRATDFQSLAASGQIPPQLLPTSVHAEMLGRPSGAMILSGLDRCSFPQTSVSGPNHISVEQGISFGQPLLKCPSGIAKQLPQCNVVLGGMPSGVVGTWSPDLLNKSPTNTLALHHGIHNGNTVADLLPLEHSQNVFCDSSQPATDNGTTQSLQNCNMLAQMLHQERSQTIPSESTQQANILTMHHNLQSGNMVTQVLPREQSQIVSPDSSQQVNVQPSCLIAPSQPINSYNDMKNPAQVSSDLIALPAPLSNSFHLGNSPAITQSHGYRTCTNLTGESLLSSQSNSAPSCAEQVFDRNDNNAGLLDSYSFPNPFSVSPGLTSGECQSGWRLQNSSGNVIGTHPSSLTSVSPSLYAIPNSIMNSRILHETGQLRDFDFSGRSVLNHISDIKPPISDMIQKQIISCDSSSRGKQEFHLDVLDGSKVGSQPVHFSPGDYMRVLSK